MGDFMTIRKFFALAILLAASMQSNAAYAQRTSAMRYQSHSSNWEHEHPFGLGVILGEPTGFNAAYQFTREVGMDVGLTYSFREYFMTYADATYSFRDLFSRP